MNKNKKRIIVTGGSGFIGSEMIRHLIQNTDSLVFNLDSLEYSGNQSNLHSISSSKRYFFQRVRIGSKREISKIFRDFLPNLVINFAAESHVDRSIDNPEIFFETNTMETLKLLEVCRDYYKTSKANFLFHHISTDEVYGDIQKPDYFSKEGDPYCPSSPYAASKASSDHLVRSFHKTFDLPVKITNCSNNYGPYQFPEKLIPHVILNALNSKKLPIYGDGSQIRDWLYVEDHINGILSVIDKGKIGETYNIGGDNQTSNLDLVRNICEILDESIYRKINIDSFKDLIIFVDDRPGHDKRYAIDCSKIKNECNWKAKHDFSSGLFKTVNWYLENKAWWQEILDKKYTLERVGLKK